MYCFNIRYETKDDLVHAKEKLSPIRPRQLLIQVFCGDPTERYVSALIEDLKEIFPDVAIIGTTTAGEIMNEESLDRTTVISFTHFEETQVCSAMVEQNDDLYGAGMKLAAKIRQAETKLVIVFGCGIKNGGAINGEPLLCAFQKACPKILVAGAQAGDNGVAQKTFVFTQDGFTDKGAAAASLSGSSLIVGNRYNLSWVPLGKRMKITHAEGTRIFTIDEKPAKDTYTHYLGENVGARLPHSAAEFPLVVQRQGVQLARHANSVLPDGSLEFMAPFSTGEEVRFAFCHSGLIAESARELFDTFKSQDYDAFFVYSCLTRKWVLGKDSKLELAPLASLAPTAGFFSYGEYYSNNGENMFLSQTMTILALSENGSGRREDQRLYGAEPEFPSHETKQIQDLQALHRLVETSANEREALIEDLQAALAEIKTLRGFIPICAKCKSIRDDQGYWNRIEKYLQTHTEAQFSHSICPDCARELYPGMFDDQVDGVRPKKDYP